MVANHQIFDCLSFLAFDPKEIIFFWRCYLKAFLASMTQAKRDWKLLISLITMLKNFTLIYSLFTPKTFKLLSLQKVMKFAIIILIVLLLENFLQTNNCYFSQLRKPTWRWIKRFLRLTRHHLKNKHKLKSHSCLFGPMHIRLLISSSDNPANKTKPKHQKNYKKI